MIDAADVSQRLEEEWRAELASDSIIELAEPIQPAITCGEYDAICLSVRRVVLENWGRGSLVFQFQIHQIGPAHRIVLPGYVNLAGNEDEKRQRRKKVALKKPSGLSKLARWWRIVLNFDPTMNRNSVDLRAFTRFMYRVTVVNVQKDHEQRPIAQAGQYQVVSEIVAVVQRLGINR